MVILSINKVQMKTADFARRVNGAKIGDLGGKWEGGFFIEIVLELR
jgi:hypothetical protein